MNENYSEKINEILDNFAPLLNSISDEEMSHKPLINKWSKKEILGHLIDSAYNNHQRFLRAEKKGNLIFDGYDQDEWVAKNNYQNRESKEVVSHFVSSNRHLAQLVSQLKTENLKAMTNNHNFDKICMIRPEKEKSTSLEYLIKDYIFHLEHHLKQVVE